MKSNQELVEKIRNEGHKKGLVENGDAGHLAIWNMLCEKLPKKAFESPEDVWSKMLHAPIVKGN